MQVVVADDSLLFREGLVRLLTEQGFDVVGQMENADDLVRRVGGLEPDLAVVDIRMPPTHTDEGLRAAQELGAKHPELGVIVLSQHLESSYAMRLLEDGTAGRGYLLKDRVADLDTFAASIKRVGEGGSVVDPEVVSALVGRRREPGPLDTLSEREREILALMAEGRSNHGISEQLVLSPRTIESHVRTIFQKLDLAAADDDHRRVLAVLAFLRAS
jgi:DNA-binding NarL/FixJ family response regulator